MMVAQQIEQSTTVLSKAVERYLECCASCHQHCSNKSSLRGREFLQVELGKGLWMTPHRSIHNLFEWHAGQTCPCGRNPSDIMARMLICCLCSPVKCEYAPQMASFTQPDTLPMDYT